MRVRACGPLGCLLGRRGACLQRAGGAHPTPLPQSLLGPPSWRPHLSLWPGFRLRLDQEPGLPGEGGHPRWDPQPPSTHRIRPAHSGPSLVLVCTQDETRAWWPRRCGGCLLLPGLTAASAGLGSALGTPGCAGRHALGGRQRKEHSSPCADGPRRAPAAPGPSPSGPPPSSVERSWQGWRSQVGIARASMRPRARPVCEPKLWPEVLGRVGAGSADPCAGPVRFPGPAPQTYQHLWRTLEAALAQGRRLAWRADHTASGAKGSVLRAPPGGPRGCGHTPARRTLCPARPS